MRIARSITTMGTAAALCGLGLLPATPAAASTWGAPPADCSTTHPDTRTTALTCTNRPAAQRWYVNTLCSGGWFDTDANGNVVTGNGTSTARCPAGSHADPYPFFVVV